VLEFLHVQSEKADADHDGVPIHERNRRILRCLLSWVRMYTPYTFLRTALNSVHLSLARR
jgi:hypothetical protein